MKRFGWLLSGLVVSLALVALAICERRTVIGLCGGEYVHPIDDTYIHIAMAKCLACSGTWGIELGKMAFCSSSSSAGPWRTCGQVLCCRPSVRSARRWRVRS